MQLKQKNSSAQIGAFKQLKVSLKWTSSVDLDLMAFYKKKDGTVGGVYSNNYAGGSLGDLNSFPFMQLSGDEGVGATSGDNCEEMRIVNLNQIDELHICALNFTDASQNNNSSFSNFDAKIEIVTDSGNSFSIGLDSQASGTVATICRFKFGFMGMELFNSSNVITFSDFKKTIPGASNLKLSSKITLNKKGDSFVIKPKTAGEILVNLNWTQSPATLPSASIDLDLGCFYELRNGRKSIIDGIQFSNNPAKKGALNSPPYIYHLGDDRTGGSDEGEFIKINISKLNEIKRMTIYAYIYEGAPRWAETDAVVTITVPGQPVVEVALGSEANSHTFCAIAEVEINANGKDVKVTKLISFHSRHRDCDERYNWGMRWRAGGK